MDNIEILNKNNKKQKWIYIISIFVFLFIIYLSLIIFSKKETIFHIAYGENVNIIANNLKKDGLIKNINVFKLFIKINNDGKNIEVGDYLIKNNLPSFMIANQIANSNHKIKQIKITIKEGLTNIEIADLLEKELQGFDKKLFLEKTIDKQGYLFPDTYFIYPNDNVNEIINKLISNFNNKTKNIFSNNENMSDIIKMASILEGESSGIKDIYVISGILWNRITLNMLLQVDVDKNTYNNTGLPNFPINNPGLLSIKASLFPSKTNYLFYLHDNERNAHYSLNYKEHKDNIIKYLK